MSPVIQNILWFAAGFTLAVICVRRTKKRPIVNQGEKSDYLSPIEITPVQEARQEAKQKTNKEFNEKVKEDIHEEKIWKPAIVAVREHLDEIFPLLRGVSFTKIDNMEDWKNLLISIHNDDLIEMWKDVIARPNLWITYLQTFGIQQDLTSEFTYVPEYDEMYSCIGDDFNTGDTYSVISPCWIYTDAENHQTVALKGKVKKTL